MVLVRLRDVACPDNLKEIKNFSARLRYLGQWLPPEWKRWATPRRSEVTVKCFVTARGIVLLFTISIWFCAKKKINTSSVCVAVMFWMCTWGQACSQNYCLLVEVLTTYFACFREMCMCGKTGQAFGNIAGFQILRFVWFFFSWCWLVDERTIHPLADSKVISLGPLWDRIVLKISTYIGEGPEAIKSIFPKVGNAFRHFFALHGFLKGILCLHRQKHPRFSQKWSNLLLQIIYSLLLLYPLEGRFKAFFEGEGMLRKVGCRHFFCV